MLLTPTNPNSPPPGSRRGWIYVQAETGTPFQSLSLNALKHQVVKHRTAMKLDLGQDWYEKWLNELCLQNSKVRCEPNRLAANFIPPLVLEGRLLWSQLHGYADSLTYANFSEHNTKTWLRLWEERLPQFSGCRCHEGYVHAISENPPNTSSPEGFQEWAVKLHNAINAKLGKPLWPYA